MNSALFEAASLDSQEIVTYLLSDAVPAAIRPTQDGVNGALESAVIGNWQEIVTYLLSDAVPEAIRPTQNGIDRAYREAVPEDLINILRPHASQLERIAQQHGNAADHVTGIAHEIHDYANTLIKVPTGSSDSSSSTSRTPSLSTSERLESAVMQSLECRVAEDKQRNNSSNTAPYAALSEDQLIAKLNAWIDAHYEISDEEEQAAEPAEYAAKQTKEQLI